VRDLIVQWLSIQTLSSPTDNDFSQGAHFNQHQPSYEFVNPVVSTNTNNTNVKTSPYQYSWGQSAENTMDSLGISGDLNNIENYQV
jgi:hypothetical protein